MRNKTPALNKKVQGGRSHFMKKNFMKLFTKNTKTGMLNSIQEKAFILFVLLALIAIPLSFFVASKMSAKAISTYAANPLTAPITGPTPPVTPPFTPTATPTTTPVLVTPTPTATPTLTPTSTPVTGFGQGVLIKNLQYPFNNFVGVNRLSNVSLNSGFTVEFWLKMNQKANYFNQTLFRDGYDLSIFTDAGPNGTSNKLSVITGDGTRTDQIIGPELAINQWNHIAVGFTPTGTNVGTLRLAINGYTLNRDNMPYKDHIYALEVGEMIYDGIMDEFRISNTVRYDTFTYPVPTQPFTNDANTLVLLHFNGNTQDSSSFSHATWTNGTVSFVNSDFNFTTPTPTPTVVPTSTPTVAPTATPTVVPTPTPTVTPAPIKQMELTIAQGSDDAWQTADANKTVNTSSQNIKLGWYMDKAGFRFFNPNLSVLRGKKIVSAYLVVASNQNVNNAISIRFFAQNSNSCNTFQAIQNNIGQRPVTASSVVWQPGKWVMGGSYNSPDLKSLVSEVVSKPTFAGNSICIIAQNYGSKNYTDRQISAKEGLRPSAKLVIKYQ